MKIDADGFSFDFTNAIDAFIFDEEDKSNPKYHGVPMKAVDIVAEFEEAYVYVEMKDFDDPDMYNPDFAADEKARRAKRRRFKWLKSYLKYKYRDTYLFRHAEQKVDKPIHYICLLTFDNALNMTMQKALKQELPIGKASRRWKREIAASCQVVNVARWNDNWPKWPVSRSETADGEV